jgi:anti-sigma regulatory factor (Ser/Thr protein kinase)
MTWPLQTYITLVAVPTAAAWARRLVVEELGTWGLVALAETVELLVSELVTNALRASDDVDPVLAERYQRQPNAVKYEDLVKISCVRLRMSANGRKLLLEVWDKSPQPPAAADLDKDELPHLESESGRGLFLVATCSAQWGWYYPADHKSQGMPEWGKVVWCIADL